MERRLVALLERVHEFRKRRRAVQIFPVARITYRMNRRIALVGAFFLGMVIAASAAAQSVKATVGPAPNTPEKTLSSYPWEFGPFLQGGIGAGNRDNYHFFAAGVKIG